MKFDEIVRLYLEDFPTTINHRNKTRMVSSEFPANNLGNTDFTGLPSGFKGDVGKGSPKERLPNDVSSLFYQKKPEKSKRKNKK